VLPMAEAKYADLRMLEALTRGCGGGGGVGVRNSG